jgi:hypothetical protein
VRTAFLSLLLALALVAPADAAVTRKKAIWGPVTVDGVSQFPIYADLGVGIYQYTLPWDAVATSRPANPRDAADPAYAWPVEIDQAIAEGAAHGITVSLMVMGTPRWANGGRPPRWAPTAPGDYADFLSAAARRYPAVRHWLIWGEPTKASNFQPLSSRRTTGPRRYARLLDRAYGALKRANRANLVIGGNSFTVGTYPPLTWIDALRLPNGRRPRMDLYGHNPFSVRRPDLSDPPLGRGYADFSDLDTLTRALDRSFPKRLRLFLSEYTLPTDHANWEFNFHVTRETQASFLTSGLRIARRWPRIYTLGYLGLYDDPERGDGRQVERGLLARDGSPKPAYAAFKNG